MYQRSISEEEVRIVIKTGETIEDYPADFPYPSRLVLGWHGPRPVHVVVADNTDDRENIVITVYEPESCRVGSRFQKEKVAMKCVVCKKGETKIGKATVTLEKDGATLVFKGVPAQVCASCGEEYLDQEITARLLQSAEEAARSGIQVEIRQYTAA